MYWKNHWVLKKKVRFGFRKLMKVGRSTEIVRLKVSTWLMLSNSSASKTGTDSNHVNSTPQLDRVRSSAKSIAKPSTLRRS